MKRLISLFDFTGTWPSPFEIGGWDCYKADIKDGFDVLDIDSCETALDMFEDVHGILSAPPCTHFTSSGAQYWPEKDHDGRTKEAMELVYQVQRLADLFRPTDPDYWIEMDEPFFWALENPVGRLPKLVEGIGEAFYFNPCDYAGYLALDDAEHNELDRLRRKDGKGITTDDALFVMRCNAYTKKTGLWGEFNRDMPKLPVEPVRCCKQGSPLQLFGGKSDRTKELRSKTPLGFATAFYQANNNWNPTKR